MYFFDAPALARALRNGAVSERQKATYLVTGSVLQYLMAWWRSASEADAARADSAGYLAHGCVLSLGIFLCYRANGAGDGERFVERFICLSLPLSIWMVAAGMGLGALLIRFLGEETYATVSPILNPVLLAAYLGIMRSLITEASRGEVVLPPPLPRSA